MSLIFSGIVVLVGMIISLVIYILYTLGWYAYRRQILSAASGGEPVKDKCSDGTRLKPDLVTFNYKKEIICDQNDDDDEEDEEANCDQIECVVCLRGLQNEELVRQLPKCKHTLHAPCIDMWLYSHSHCPICRTPIDRLPSQENGVLTPGRNSQEVRVDISSSPSIDRLPSVFGY